MNARRHNCLILTSSHFPKQRYTARDPKIYPSPTFHKISKTFINCLTMFMNYVYDP